MPSSTAAGPKFRALQGGGRYRMVPDFVVERPVAAAEFTGANSGVVLFQCPNNVRGAVFLGASEHHGTVGVGSMRIKKITDNSAAGAAASATNVDLTASIPVGGSTNVVRDYDPVTANAVNVILPGQRIAAASAAGITGLAASVVSLRLAWL